MATGKLGTKSGRLGVMRLGANDADTPPLNPLEVDVEQTLSFSQSAEGLVIGNIAENTLAFSQTALASVVRAVAVSQSLVFTDDAGSAQDVAGIASNTLAFTQQATHNIKQVDVSQSLALVQELTWVGPKYVSVGQSLNLNQGGTDGRVGVINRFVGQALVFQQTAGRVLSVSVSQSIAFSQSGERRNIVTHTLGLSQSVTVGKGGTVDQTLQLVDVVARQLILSRSLSQTLALLQSTTFYIERGCTAKSYSPFVGGAVPGYTPPSTTPPTLSRDTLTLTYPYVSPSTTLSLRNPAFGNKDRLNFNRINRETRGGTLIVFADPKWPKTQTLVVQIDALTRNQIVDLLAFISISLGKEIGLLDWEGRQWRGVIVTPDAQVTHVSKHDRSVTFEFQGMLA